MMRSAIAAGCCGLLWVLFGSSAAGTNRLVNADFEATGGWRYEGAASGVNEWRSHGGGKYNAALMGMWYSRGTFGAIEQDGIPVRGGETHLLTAWLWADISWYPQRQSVRIGYFNAEHHAVDTQEYALPRIMPHWQRVAWTSTAPLDAVTACIRFQTEDVDFHGALTVDDLYFGTPDGAPSD